MGRTTSSFEKASKPNMKNDSKACTQGSHLRSVEDAELIHVIPDIQVLGGALVLTQHELLSPPVTSGRV